ncbi:hypothetical protein CR513_03758, partial [Mucuna pruriens]
MSLYWIVFGKAYHLPMEIEHKAYLAVKQCNLDYDQAGKQRQFQQLSKPKLMPTLTPSWPDLDKLWLGLTNFNSSHYKARPKNQDYRQPQGIKELWNCFGSKLRSSVGETLGNKKE